MSQTLKAILIILALALVVFVIFRLVNNNQSTLTSESLETVEERPRFVPENTIVRDENFLSEIENRERFEPEQTVERDESFITDIENRPRFVPGQ